MSDYRGSVHAFICRALVGSSAPIPLIRLRAASRCVLHQGEYLALANWVPTPPTHSVARSLHSLD